MLKVRHHQPVLFLPGHISTGYFQKVTNLGWYKNDSLNHRSEEKARKFRITWEEAATIEPVVPSGKTEKNNIFRRLKKVIEKEVKRDTTKGRF